MQVPKILEVRKISRWTYLLMLSSSVLNPIVYVLHLLWEAVTRCFH